jgi:hypothetical protein
LTPATCAHGEVVGSTNTVMTDRRTVYDVQNCASVNTVYRSVDAGRTWNAVGEPLTGVAEDEAQISADPAHPSVLYVVSHVTATGFRSLVVTKSTDGGRTWTPSLANTAATRQELEGDFHNFYGPVLVDPRDSNRLYLFWNATPLSSEGCAEDGNATYHLMSESFLATSTDAGATWHERLIRDLGPGGGACPVPTDPTSNARASHYDVANLFPSTAIDRSGNIYLLNAETDPGKAGRQPTRLVLMASSDQGRHFQTTYVRAGYPTNFAPSIVAGDAGRVDLAWEASTAPDATTSNAAWHIEFARSGDAAAAHPHFHAIAVSGVVHRGPLCPACGDSGGPLPSSTSWNAEHQFVGLAADACGRAFLMWYVDPKHEGPPPATIYVARQSTGPRISHGC